MRIVVIGGTGLIGSKVVARLTEEGHEAVAASPNSGVNTLTGEGLADVLVGADVVVDVSNSPSFEDAAVHGLLHPLHDQPAGRRTGSGRRPPRRPLDRGNRAPARQRLLPGQSRAGGADPRFRGSLHARARNAVLRVRGRNRRQRDGRRHRATAACPHAADRRRRRRDRGRRAGARSARERNGAGGWSRAVRHGRLRPARPLAPRAIRGRWSPIRRRAISAPTSTSGAWCPRTAPPSSRRPATRTGSRSILRRRELTDEGHHCRRNRTHRHQDREAPDRRRTRRGVRVALDRASTPTRPMDWRRRSKAPKWSSTPRTCRTSTRPAHSTSSR